MTKKIRDFFVVGWESEPKRERSSEARKGHGKTFRMKKDKGAGEMSKGQQSRKNRAWDRDDGFTIKKKGGGKRDTTPNLRV